MKNINKPLNVAVFSYLPCLLQCQRSYHEIICYTVQCTVVGNVLRLLPLVPVGSLLCTFSQTASIPSLSLSNVFYIKTFIMAVNTLLLVALGSWEEEIVLFMLHQGLSQVLLVTTGSSSRIECP